MLLSHVINLLCSKEETVHVVLEVLTDINIPGKNQTKLGLCNEVVRALCRFKDFDAAKKLIFTLMIADGLLPCPSKKVFNLIISAYVEAGKLDKLWRW